MRRSPRRSTASSSTRSRCASSAHGHGRRRYGGEIAAIGCHIRQSHSGKISNQPPTEPGQPRRSATNQSYHDKMPLITHQTGRYHHAVRPTGHTTVKYPIPRLCLVTPPATPPATPQPHPSEHATGHASPHSIPPHRSVPFPHKLHAQAARHAARKPIDVNRFTPYCYPYSKAQQPCQTSSLLAPTNQHQYKPKDNDATA